MIKAFSQEDLKKCCDLYIQVFNFPPWNDAWTQETAQTRLQDFADNKRFAGYTLWDANELIGAVFAHTSMFYKGNELYIDELFVSQTHQKKGCGTALMNKIEAYAKENDCVNITLLTVRGKPAFDFYEKLGYKSLDYLAFMHKRV